MSVDSQQQSTAETAHIWEHAEANFARNVRRLRELRGMSQSQLAKDLSDHGFVTFHQTTIKRIEQGIQPPKLSEVLALCFVLGVTLEDSLVTEDIEFRQDAGRVEVTRRPPVELGDQLAVEQRLNSLAKTLASQLGQLDVMQRQTRRHLEELRRPTSTDDLMAVFDDLASESTAEVAAVRDERERDVIVALARFGYGINKISEILDLPVAHIRATLGSAEPVEQRGAVGRFELYKDQGGQFRFRLRAGNGEVIAVSEAYTTKAGAENGIESVKANASAALVEVRSG